MLLFAANTNIDIIYKRTNYEQNNYFIENRDFVNLEFRLKPTTTLILDGDSTAQHASHTNKSYFTLTLSPPSKFQNIVMHTDHVSNH